MKTSTRTRFVSDVESRSEGFTASSPFKVQNDNQRRFVRLEISVPMSLNKIKEYGGSFWPQGNSYTINGTILNLSAGGVLVELDEVLNEGDIVSMRFTIQNEETLDNVIGVVKRSEQLEEPTSLTGIEFISKERLSDLLSSGELKSLPNNLFDFQQSVERVLNKYIRRESLTRNERE
ncbi:MAG: PilZ domain-containing protein [Candidatus Zixiibacteriota bacterium]